MMGATSGAEMFCFSMLLIYTFPPPLFSMVCVAHSLVFCVEYVVDHLIRNDICR